MRGSTRRTVWPQRRQLLQRVEKHPWGNALRIQERAGSPTRTSFYAHSAAARWSHRFQSCFNTRSESQCMLWHY